MRKLGLIAGGGDLPRTLAQRCVDAGRPFFVVRLKGFADEAMAEFPGADIGMAELGKCFSALKKAGCETVCFAGLVARPDFAALKPDMRGMMALPRVISAARRLLIASRVKPRRLSPTRFKPSRWAWLPQTEP